LWGQREFTGQYGNDRTPGTRFFNKKPSIIKDNDGDIRMKGAKVDMEKARRERLCFHCSMPEHQARFCRKRKQGDNRKEKQSASAFLMNNVGAADSDLDTCTFPLSIN